MKRLTLVRHAHAKVQNAAVTDFERPLSRRGKREAKATAIRLREQELIPELLLASPAQRTLLTAQILARELALAERGLRLEESLYLGSAEKLLNVIRAIGPRIGHLMVVAHNPGVSVLADVLAPEAALGEFATGAACTMEFELDSWAAINAGSATKAARKSRAPRLFGLFK